MTKMPRCAASALTALALWPTSIALGGQPAPGATRHGGTLDIRLEVFTRPGGETVNVGGAVLSPVNVGVAISARGVRVNKDGTFSFEASGNYHFDSRSTDATRLTVAEDRADRVSGKGRFGEEGALTLELMWGHGPGLQVYNSTAGGGTVQQPATQAVPLPPWNLSPDAREVEKLGPDRQRETVKYQARRPSTVVGTAFVPLTERIEIKHVRDKNVVPRG